MVDTMNDTSKSPAPVLSKTDATANDRFAQAKAARQAAIAKRDNDRTKSPREREDDLGGPRLKLSVIGDIPGYTMYWENDEDGRIEQLLFEGFDFVEPGEVNRAADLVADMDLGSRISRYVGRREDGSPLRAYLLKLPTDMWNKRKLREQSQTDEWDDQIRNGRMKPQDRNQYTPQGYESVLDTHAKL